MSPGDEPPPQPPAGGGSPPEDVGNELPDPSTSNAIGDPTGGEWDDQAFGRAIEAMDREGDPTYHGASKDPLDDPTNVGRHVDPLEDPTNVGRHVDPLEDLTAVGRQVDPLDDVGHDPDPYGEHHRSVDPLDELGVGEVPNPGEAALQQLLRDADAERQAALRDSEVFQERGERTAALADAPGLPTAARLAILGCAIAIVLLGFWLWFLNDGGDPPQTLPLPPAPTAAPASTAPASTAPPTTAAPASTAPATTEGAATATTSAAGDDWCSVTQAWFAETGFGPTDGGDPDAIAESQTRARPYLEQLLGLAPDEATRAAVESILADPDQTTAYPVLARYTQQHCDWASALSSGS